MTAADITDLDYAEDAAWDDWRVLNEPRGARVTEMPEAGPWVDPHYLKRAEVRLRAARQARELLPDSARMIAAECDHIKAFLIDKNLKYGNSALDPVRIFSNANTVEQLLVRIDDKLSRLKRGGEYSGDDTTLDLIGYLILLRVATKETK